MGNLFLGGLTQLDKASSSALALFQGKGLYLNGVNHVDKATAKALALFKAYLSMRSEIRNQIKKYKK